MNINRHNYEEFFLLYVDNELSATDRKAVELYVLENPDLGIELDLLKQTILPAESIVLEKKDWLYMEEEISSLQEGLLMYADDELPEADKKLAEGLLKTDKAAQAEWQILQQTKLQPDTSIVFEDKASLYRREPSKVVAIRWWRVAAAAVLIGFGIWGGVSVYINSTTTVTTEGSVATQDNKGSTPGKNNDPAENANVITADQQAQRTINDATTASAPGKTASSSQTTDEINNGRNRGMNPNSNPENNNIAAQSPEKQDNNLPKPYLQNINSNSSNQNVVASVEPESNNISRVSGNNNHVIENNTIITGNTNRADQPVAALQVANIDNASANNRYLDTDDKQKRTALSGLLRKAKRVVERTTNINTGEGIKIAGFEIALK